MNGHPAWCDLSRCTVANGTGLHQSATVVVTTGNRKRVPRIVLLVVSAPAGPAKLRLVVESDVIVNAVEVDIDTAALVARQIERLVASTAPAE